MDEVAAYRERQAKLRKASAALVEGMPNLRDFGQERREEYEAAVARQHAVIEQLRAEMEANASAFYARR